MGFKAGKSSRTGACEISSCSPALAGLMMVRFTGCFVQGQAPVAQVDVASLGRPASPDDIRLWNIDVAPDGDGLPPGRGTVQQGAVLYAAKCAKCHGPSGTKGPRDRSVGGRNSLSTSKPLKTIGSYWPYATTRYDY